MLQCRFGGFMKGFFVYPRILGLSTALLLVPFAASAQQENSNPAPSEPRGINLTNFQQTKVPPEVRQAEDTVERAARRFRLGVEAGVGLDPELLMFGGHGAFGPVFHPNVEVRPGVEFGLGEVTTLFGINVDVLYLLPGAARGNRWMPYVGAGPNFALSHRAFDSDDEIEDDDTGNRFDFSDTDFVSGFNFFAGARTVNGMFLEFKSTAYGVSTIRFLVGYNF
jgi:hypothetical protein